MEYICKCNNCDSLLIDNNPQVGAKQYDVDSLSLNELISIEDMRACPNCKTDEYLTDSDKLGTARELYKLLDNICIDENDDIDEEFLHFPIGTPNTEIWHWFEETFDVSIMEDLAGF